MKWGLACCGVPRAPGSFWPDPESMGYRVPPHIPARTPPLPVPSWLIFIDSGQWLSLTEHSTPLLIFFNSHCRCHACL